MTKGPFLVPLSQIHVRKRRRGIRKLIDAGAEEKKKCDRRIDEIRCSDGGGWIRPKERHFVCAAV